MREDLRLALAIATTGRNGTAAIGELALACIGVAILWMLAAAVALLAPDRAPAEKWPHSASAAIWPGYPANRADPASYPFSNRDFGASETLPRKDECHA
jgi:hypothetical protein